MNQARNGQPLQWQQAWIEELSSALIIVLLVPCVLWLVRHLPLQINRWRRLLWHLPAFVVFTGVHVSLFVVLRKFWFAAIGSSYAFDSPWWFGLAYEARIDLLTYLLIVGLAYGYYFVLNRLRGEASFPRSGGHQYPSQFLIKMLRTEHLVAVSDIDWIAAARNYLLLHVGTREYPMRCTMTAMEEQLDPAGFVRVHRSAIVNLRRVTKLIELPGEASVELGGGGSVPVSASHLAELKQRLQTATPPV
ncbi:MAG: LytTR family DNA-binding domain-containing protein [Pseudomonadales bacterium]